MRYNYIAIEGNIGSGKTSLTHRIAEEFNARTIFERFEDNSFLPKFYKDPDKYAFPLEMSFLADRYQQLKDELAKGDLFKSFTIADYFIDKSLIFARNNLQSDEFNLYARLFEIINSTLPKPELIVYLYNNIDRVQSNIKKRGRSYEINITDNYLEKIQEGYFNYFRQNKLSRVLIIDTQKIDFVENAEDYEKIKRVINKEYTNGVHRITFL
ncbi:MAG TPA: deoxynucleoside kinase [Bacteroidales bacterium]|nr:deoxynucleoside kinase [Bacteroidales bacterium]HPE58077.1 deoxynucleoside kinase [Bacteroidales bacterium]HRX96907.1 deoxynucleoside kinase [Bacteroidales bacterium]